MTKRRRVVPSDLLRIKAVDVRVGDVLDMLASGRRDDRYRVTGVMDRSWPWVVGLQLANGDLVPTHKDSLWDVFREDAAVTRSEGL